MVKEKKMVGGSSGWVIKLQEIIFSNGHNIQFGL